MTLIDTEAPIETSRREPLAAPAPLADVIGLSPRLAQAREIMEQVERDPSSVERIAADQPPPFAPITIPENYQPPYVPREYKHATFEIFDVEKAGAEHKANLSLALRAVRKWVSVAKHDRRAMLALVGSQGNGKSTLLYSAVNMLAMNGVRVFSRPWYRLADELRYGGPSPFMPEGQDIDSHALRRLLYRARVVVIDEVRPTANTAFDDTELAKFACHAWDEGIAVLISTNVSPLANVMGAAAADRFTCITITAPSQRQA